MTGKYNFRNYIGFGLMAPDEVTFGHLFSDAGYKTCISGKWQLYSYQFPDEDFEMRGKGQRIEDAGFDEYCVWHAHHTEAKGSRYKDPVIYENGSYRDDTAGKYGDDVFADYAMDFIERNKDEEFFVYFPMALTHRPFEPTPDDLEFDSFEPEPNKTLGASTRISDDWGDDPDHYKSMVEYHDKVIGRLSDKLEELGIADSTLVIYVGDNGSPQEVCNIRHNHMTSCGGKGLTLDRGTHVPMICSWPGTIPSGSVPLDLVDSSDFLPTILEAAEITPPEDYVMDGRSFLPQLKGDKGNPREWMFFHFEPMSANPAGIHPNVRFIRDNRWKIYDDGRMYDLNSDPEEESVCDAGAESQECADARARLEPIFAQMVPGTLP
jgi:arylsulfatase A-like enzyme